MDIFDILLLIGGLALFLYGMTEMGNGLEKVSGSKLKSILEKLTSSKTKGVLLGAGVTAFIQSSSATAVMVVGLVNSSIMTLSQAIPVVMGANVGTTITSWLLSLTGIQSDNIIVNLFKPSSFAPILAVVGYGFIMFSDNEKRKDTGKVFLGFTVLMFGMNLMSNAVAPLADVAEFRSILITFSNPILGVIAGAFVTAMLQSSSASIGILQALALTGVMNYSVAIPVIMGQNIGTCITAFLAGIGANKNAKRVSVVHLFFNLIGTALFILCFYCINALVKFTFLNEPTSTVGIAVIHTIFNITTTLILLPFSEVLKKASVSIIKDDNAEKSSEFQKLDVRLIETPGYALKISNDMTQKMLELARENFMIATDLIDNYDNKRAREVQKIEEKVDKYEDEIGSYLLKISMKDLTENDNRLLTLLLHSIGEYERISDLSVNIMESAKEMNEKNICFSKNANSELEVLIGAVRDILDMTLDVAAHIDVTKAEDIEPLEEVIDFIAKELNKRHVIRLKNGECTAELGFVLADITTSLERISDHCSNIAVYVIQLSINELDIHEYLDKLKHKENNDFYKKYKKIKKQYKLSKI